MRQLKFPALLLAIALAGCGGQPPAGSDPEPAPAAVVELDNADAVKALGAAAKELRKDGNGLVTQVNLRGAEVSDELLQHLTELKNVTSLLLNDTNITDDSLKIVNQVTTLRNLDLRGCKISNAGLANITGLKNLATLKLTGKGSLCTVDDDGMDSLAKLTSLRSLALDSLWISGDGLQKLSPLTKLEELYIGGDDNLMDDSSMEVIVANFPKLKKLRISKSTVTGEGIATLSKLTTLEELDLGECSQLFDASLQHLAPLKSLNRLNLWRLAITNDGFAHLASLTNLKWLNVDNTRVTDDGLKHLTGMNNLQSLYLGSTAVTDAGLVHLEGLKSLKEVDVARTAVTKEGAAKLKEKLPAADIKLFYIED